MITPIDRGGVIDVGVFCRGFATTADAAEHGPSPLDEN